ncbi:TPA: hypothetical protein ACH3X2_012389 [Trebouxia sp. C0005]
MFRVTQPAMSLLRVGSSASKQGSEGVSRKRKAPDAKMTMEGAMRAQFQMYAPDYAAQEWQDWKMDNHMKVNETCLLMEKNFDNKYKLDRPQMIAKIREHYNYKRKMARGSTPGTSSSMEDSSSVDASQAGNSGDVAVGAASASANIAPAGATGE